MKTKTQINMIISIVLSLYISIKGSMTNGWFTCISVTQVTECGFLKWIIQVVVLIIIFALILLGIEKLVVDSYNKYTKKIKKNIKKEEVEKKTEKVEENQTKDKSDDTQETVEPDIQEEEPKKVVNI